MNERYQIEYIINLVVLCKTNVPSQFFNPIKIVICSVFTCFRCDFRELVDKQLRSLVWMCQNADFGWYFNSVII